MAENRRPILDWSTAPDWANYHVFQPWSNGMWSDVAPFLGQHSHNHGRWNVHPVAKSRVSQYELPIGFDHRETLEERSRPKQPRTIVCLCGSTRFSAAYQQANLQETLAGKIVLTIGCDMRNDKEIFVEYTPDELIAVKEELDELHLDKIALAHEVLILSEDGYIGESTARELEYARTLGKKVRFWEDEEIKVTM